MTLSGLLWVLFIVLLIAWVFGFAIGNLGSVVHLLLVLALALLVYNLLVGRRPAI